MAGREENKKLKEYENDYFLLRWSDRWYSPYNWLGLSDEDNSVSRYWLITLWMWMFTSPRVRSYRCVFYYFSTMPVGFYLTFGLKPEVGGIKIVTV